MTQPSNNSMRRDDSKTPDDLNRPEGNDLVSNYELHDVADVLLRRKLDEADVQVEFLGIDKRHDGGEDGLIFSGKPDFRCWHDGDIVGYVDLKSKSNPDWFGICNERAFDNYLNGETSADTRTAERPFPGARSLDVPVYIYFILLDDDTLLRDAFVRVDSYSQIDRTWEARDGNDVVAFKDDQFESYPSVLDTILPEAATEGGVSVDDEESTNRIVL